MWIFAKMDVSARGRARWPQASGHRRTATDVSRQATGVEASDQNTDAMTPAACGRGRNTSPVACGWYLSPLVITVGRDSL